MLCTLRNVAIASGIAYAHTNAMHLNQQIGLQHERHGTEDLL